MGSNFFSTTIGEQLTLQRGFDITKKEQKEGNVPVVSSGGISSYHNVSKVVAPGVVLGRKGTLGTVFLLDKDFWPHDTSLWVKDFKGNNPHFVYYFFKSMSAELKKMDVGAANPALNRNHVHPLQVEWPSREVQDKIASIGAALDQKITLNNQINQTLEQIAQTLFKSWFVDFDPVKAKMTGERPKGMDAATASLFPDKVVESDLGLVPEGWVVGNLTKLAKLDTTSVKPNKEPEVIWEHFSIPAFDDGIYPSFDTGESIKSNKYKVKANAVLVSKLNPRFQRIWLPLPEDADKAICSTEFMQFVPNVPTLKPYLYGLVKSSPFQSELLNTVTGTTGSRQRAQPKQVAKAQVVVPPVELMALYSEKVDSILTMMQKNFRQSIELAKLRDTLLPKLLSGEIDLENLQVKQVKALAE
ncbi:restriction endonuclease subunit S [Vibrio lentus]|uniref:restriction endonuclease subunit S n=1 Tax=Vibrio lentus TaxID=136468 RepID=UPI000C82F09A|nr:restriction endonuclease subunit S [Vibrio lentus]PMH08654.1 hypothetical protein BCU76_04740 [Vibrio lentus]PMK92817.1 hypothetical protein BCT89_20205 [Vibrio lentus]